MNWDAIGAVGQVLGSVAVFITLGYLAVQIRYARGELRRSVNQNRFDGVREIAMGRANNEHWCSSYAKANAGLGAPLSPFITALMERSGLTVEEASGLLWDQLAFWQVRVLSILNVDEMTAEARSELDRNLRYEYGSGAFPVARLWYETAKGSANSEAVRYIDKLLAQPG
jgi:hypothetical protein